MMLSALAPKSFSFPFFSPFMFCFIEIHSVSQHTTLFIIANDILILHAFQCIDLHFRGNLLWTESVENCFPSVLDYICGCSLFCSHHRPQQNMLLFVNCRIRSYIPYCSLWKCCRLLNNYIANARYLWLILFFLNLRLFDSSRYHRPL